MAPLIFLEVWQKTILPYTPGSTFTVENAYKINGIAPKNVPNQPADNGGGQPNDSISDIQSRAQNLIDEAEKAISDAKIKEKAKTVWDTIVDLFQLNFLKDKSITLVSFYILKSLKRYPNEISKILKNIIKQDK